MIFKKRRKKSFGGIYRANRGPKYKNPRRAKNKQLVASVFFYINIVLIVVLIYFIYFFIFSPYFHIDNIQVVGTEKISSFDVTKSVENYLDENRLWIFKNRNMLLLSKNKLEERLGENFIFNDLKINKQFPNLLILEINEKIPIFEFSSNSKNYLIDNTGLVIQRMFGRENLGGVYSLTLENNIENVDYTDFSYERLPLVYNQEAQPVNIGETIINSSEIEYISNFIKLAKNYDFIQIKRIMIPGKFPQHFVIMNKSGEWQFFLNFKDDLAKQLQRLSLVIEEKITIPKLQQVDYIDLRMGENVYFKYK